MSETANSHGTAPDYDEKLREEKARVELRRRNSLGRHVLVDFYGVQPHLLTDEPALAGLLRSSLEEAGFNILDLRSHKFPGDEAGVTCMALLAESHATFHSYPELNYLAVDIFCCGRPDPYVAVDAIANALNPHQADVVEQPRGARLPGGVPANWPN